MVGEADLLPKLVVTTRDLTTSLKATSSRTSSRRFFQKCSHVLVLHPKSSPPRLDLSGLCYSLLLTLVDYAGTLKGLSPAPLCLLSHHFTSEIIMSLKFQAFPEFSAWLWTTSTPAPTLFSFSIFECVWVCVGGGSLQACVHMVLWVMCVGAQVWYMCVKPCDLEGVHSLQY